MPSKPQADKDKENTPKYIVRILKTKYNKHILKADEKGKLSKQLDELHQKSNEKQWRQMATE